MFSYSPGKLPLVSRARGFCLPSRGQRKGTRRVMRCFAEQLCVVSSLHNGRHGARLCHPRAGKAGRRQSPFVARAFARAGEHIVARAALPHISSTRSVVRRRSQRRRLACALVPLTRVFALAFGRAFTLLFAPAFARDVPRDFVGAFFTAFAVATRFLGSFARTSSYACRTNRSTSSCSNASPNCSS